MELIRLLMIFVMIFFCVVISCVLINESRNNRVLEKATERMRQVQKMVGSIVTDKYTMQRLAEEELVQKKEGNHEKKKFLYKIDEMLLQSGVRKKLPFFTTELYLTILIFLFCAVLFIASKILNSFIFGLIIALIFTFTINVMMRALQAKNKRKVTENILEFANMLENYSRTNDDIVSIFGSVYPFLNEPLKTAIKEAYGEMTATGDISTAFARLDAKIGNKKCSELLQNIEMCSRHETNYKEVIRGNKMMIKAYLAEANVRKQMARSARIKIAILFAGGGIMCMALNRILENKLLSALSSSMPGKVIAAYCIFVIAFSLWKILTIGQEEQ